MINVHWTYIGGGGGGGSGVWCVRMCVSVCVHVSVLMCVNEDSSGSDSSLSWLQTGNACWIVSKCDILRYTKQHAQTRFQCFFIYFSFVFILFIRFILFNFLFFDVFDNITNTQ